MRNILIHDYLNAMQAIRLKAKVSANHRLELSLPEEIPEGEVEVIIMYTATAKEPNSPGLLSFLESLDGIDYPRRSLRDIMTYVQQERLSWNK